MTKQPYIIVNGIDSGQVRGYGALSEEELEKQLQIERQEFEESVARAFERGLKHMGEIFGSLQKNALRVAISRNREKN